MTTRPIRTTRIVQFNCKLTKAEYAFLRRHAMIRDVSVTHLASHILVNWIRRATPKDEPVFGVNSIGFLLPELPPEKYKGFSETLMFLPEAECEVDANKPPPFSQNEAWPDE
jgi:hypothetical protein